MTRFIKLARARGTILAGLAMSLLFAGAMTAVAAEVSTAPSAGPGSDITISGSVDLVGLEQVDLCWDAPRCDNLASVQLGLLQTTYTVTVTVPESAGPGGHDIYACTALRGCTSTSIEVVLPPPPTTTTTVTTTTTTPPTTPTTTTTTAPPSVTSTPPTSTTTTTSPAAAAPDPPTTTTTTTMAATTSTVSSQVEVVAARSEGSDLTKQQDQGVTPPPTTTSSTAYQPPIVAAAAQPSPPETTRPTNNPSTDDVSAVELTLPQAPVGWTIDWSVLVWAGALLVVVIITCRLMIWSLSSGVSNTRRGHSL